MKLKTLLIIVALLAAASAVVYLVQRPQAPAAGDPRVGQPLLASDVVEKATAVEITDAGQTVTLRRQADGSWQVTSFHDLPADFGKLSRFIKDLTDAKIERVVTSNPEALARLDFGATTLRLLGEDGQALWTLALGRTADGGGRFVKYGEENKAYRARLTAWLDTTAKNWADSSLLALKPEEVAKVEIGFPGDGMAPVRVERGTAEEPFKAATGSDRTVRQAVVSSLLTSLTGLRFTDTTTPGDPAAVAARAHQRRVVLTTFAGDQLAVALGRKPEEKVEKPAAASSTPTEDTPAGDPADRTDPEADEASATENVPAGPVFAMIEGDAKHAKLASASDRLAFKVSDYVFTSLPKAPDDLFEPPAPTGPGAPSPQEDSPAEPAPAP